MFGLYLKNTYLCSVDSHQPLTQVKLVGLVLYSQFIYSPTDILNMV